MNFPATSEFALNDISHVLFIGQSLALGSNSGTPISTYQRNLNRMFRGGVLGGTEFSTATDYTGLDALVERGTETPAFGFTDYLAYKAGRNKPFMVSNCAVGGQTLAALSKGTASYIMGLQHIRHGRHLLGNRGRVTALLSFHGESDSVNPTYNTELRQWQLDYETDINALQGTSGRRPIFSSQNGWPDFGSSQMNSVLGMLSEHEANPTKSILVGPRYFLTHTSDGIHMPAASYRRLGEYYGKAYYQHVIQGTQWEPLRPTVTRSGAVITVDYTGAVGGITLDTTLVSNPGNYGFSYTDDGTPPAISNVSITGLNQIKVTLASTPSGANKKLQYGFNGNAFAGPTTGRRGCVRDNDTATSPYDGTRLYNWGVYFEKAAT